jgi:hypothetical protein
VNCPRALSDQEAVDAENWYSEYERVGTFEAKAKQLGVAKDTLRDAIRRVRNQPTRTWLVKLASFSEDLRRSIPANVRPDDTDDKAT